MLDLVDPHHTLSISSMTTAFFFSSWQYSRIRWMTRQPNGCVLSGTTHARKLSSSGAMRPVSTHSMHFWITWLPFCRGGGGTGTGL